MEGFLTMGAGRIGWATEHGPEWASFPLIAVTTSGIVLYMDETGQENVSGIAGIEVEITDVEWSAFSKLTDLAAERSQPKCSRCLDDDTNVAAMVPPRCPQCHRRVTRN